MSLVCHLCPYLVTAAATDATPSSATPSSASDGPDLILTVVAHVVVVLAVILFIIVVAIILFIVGVKKCRAAKKGKFAATSVLYR